MERVADLAAEMAWLAPWWEDGRATGVDAEGPWAASTWVLHTAYVDARLRHLGTHDQVRRAHLAAGPVDPDPLPGMDELTVLGCELGHSGHPGAGWARTTWRELGLLPGSADFPPGARWFPAGGFPAAVRGLNEGSMDEESFAALLAVLREWDGDVECLAYLAPAANDWGDPVLLRGRLSSLPGLLLAHGGTWQFTPSNIWPRDRSWFVLTDHDLTATKVSGSEELVTAIEAAPGLETVRWPVTGRRT